MTECVVSCMCSGYNASGYSSLVSLERLGTPTSNERHIVSRCIVNCGDSTQRYCNEKRIKLSSVSCIIITSLAPHNISGFPGVFLALSDLGVGSIIVIGPAGLQSTLDLMLPFTNRKYPALSVLEVDHYTSPEKLVVQTDHFAVRVRPVAVSESNSKVIAVAATIITDAATKQTEKSNTLCMVSIFPLACYFDTFPNIRAMVDESVADVLTSYGFVQNKIFLFAPLAVSSFDIHAMYELGPDLEGGQFSELLILCKKHTAKALYTAGNLSKDAFECGYSQRMISILSHLSKPLFPEMALSGIGKLVPAPASSSEYEDFLRLAAPGVSISAQVGAGRHAKVPLLPTEAVFGVDDSAVADIVEKSAVALQLYRSAVLPRLSELLMQPPPASMQFSVPPPPPPPPPQQLLLPFGSAGLNNNFVWPPPPPPPPAVVFRPPVPQWPSPPLPSPSIFLTLPVAEPPSPAYTENRGMSISVSMSSLPSRPSMGEISNVSTPSPQTTNFAAASSLRANLLNKRKKMDMGIDTGTCESTPRDSTDDVSPGLQQASTERSSEAAMESARSLISDAAMSVFANTEQEDSEETEDGVRVSPMKSLRLNDSSKQFTFPQTDVGADLSSSMKKRSPLVHKAAGGKEKDDIYDNSDVAKRVEEENVALSKVIFRVPPPNPFMDVCTLAFLGTGSATPSKYRNGSCIMLTLNGRDEEQQKTSFSDSLFIETSDGPTNMCEPATGSANANVNKPIMLLDVGEGTAAQIFQSVNCDVERFDQALLSIRVIWISHHHADHITGVPMLIEHVKRARLRREAANKGDLTESGGDTGSRNSLRRVPTFTKYDMRSMYTSGGYEPGKIMIIGSESVLKYFEFSCCIAGLDDLVSFTPIVNTLYAGATKEIAAATDGLITRLRSIPVQHCHGSYGLVLDFKSTHKIVYSGDCRPSQSLVKAGIGCDLLIHEATFDDSKQEDAVKKRHSTSSEARRIAAQMHAKHTILTHFSQRYPLEVSNALGELSRLVNETGSSHDFVPASATAGRVTEAAVAYDFLRFSFPSQVAVLPRVTAALGAVLTAVEMERKAALAAAAVTSASACNLGDFSISSRP